MNRIWLLTSVIFHFTFICTAQDVKTVEIIQDRIEFLANDEEADLQDYSELIDDLTDLLNRGVDINSEAELLFNAGLINRKQLKAIKKHLELNGPIEFTYELQTLDGFGSADVKRILPFIARKDRMSKAPVGKERKSTTFIIRTQRVVEMEKGYSSENGYLGNPYKVYARFQGALSKNCNLAWLVEKDAGEPWFNENQRKGFDFYSFNLVKNLKGKDNKIILGDFHLNLGQGLLSWSGAGRRKSADVLQIKGLGKSLKASNSSNEASYFRGLAVEKGLSRQSTILLFYSLKFVDASLNEEESEITSLPTSGLHRNENEIQKKNKAIKEDVGIEWKNKFNRHHLGFSLIGSDTRINSGNKDGFPTSSDVFEVGSWATSANLNLSYDFADVFSEIATDFEGGNSALLGIITAINSHLSLSLLNRYLRSGGFNNNSNSFSESRGNSEESGIYLGMEVHPNNHFQISMYSDYFNLKSTKSPFTLPYNGSDRLLQLKIQAGKKLELLLRAQGKTKEKLTKSKTELTDIQVAEKIRQYRTELKYQLSEHLELRWRYHIKTYELSSSELEYGQLFFQDILYRSEGNRFSVSLRYALINTESYNSRIYAYENDLLYAFSIPAYYDNAARYYVLLSKKFDRVFQIWLRFARTAFYDRNTIGSGSGEIKGNKKSEVKVQLRINF